MKETVKEICGGVAFIALVAFTVWAYCKATPDQHTAEAVRLTAEIASTEGGAE